MFSNPIDDLHMVKNEWGMTQYPVVPGHEIVGVVTEVGKNVTKVKVGDKVGIGCLVGSCRQCEQCDNDLEIYCMKQCESYSTKYVDGSVTYGGVKFAKAFGANVTVISTSISKKEEAIGKLGADKFLLSSDSEQMKAATGTLDKIINIVSAKIFLAPLLSILKPRGKLIMVGAPLAPLDLPVL